ncbi:MAG: hypothetical protein QXO75_04800 [Nitrososphaerota archaeon]
MKYEISNNRKIYSLTPLGTAYLNENSEVTEKLSDERNITDKIGRFGFMNTIKEVEAPILKNTEYLALRS